MVAIGIIVAYRENVFFMNWNDWLSLVTLMMAFYFSWMCAVSVNDVYDIDIDRISNADRPLPQGEAGASDMRTAEIIFFLLALTAGYLSGYYAFFCVLAFNVLYYIYSAPPIRLKRLPVFSTFVIGFCSLAAAMAGFFTFSPVKEVSAFPAALIVGIVAFFSLMPNVRDLKDFAGDRAAKIWTIPTMFGPIWGFRIVGAMAALGYLLIPLIAFRPILFFGAIPAAGLTYWLATRKPYVEWPMFVVYFVFALFLGLLIL
jgi:chlorophyll synthase